MQPASRTRFPDLTPRWAAVAVAGLVAMSVVPVLMIQLSGTAGAGISAGFAAPFDRFVHVIAFALIGMVALRRGKLTFFLLPTAALLMMAVGGLTDPAMAAGPLARAVLFMCVMLFALVLSAGFSRWFVTAASLCGGLSFYAGAVYAAHAPGVAAPGYFLLGCVLSSGLVMACGASVSLVLGEHLTRALQRASRMPAFGPFFTFL